MARSLSEIQAAFGAAVTDPTLPIPKDIRGRGVAADCRRFAVYRNNVMVGLVDALQSRFPVAEKLVGTAFFRAMARIYVARHKPRTPLLMQYGDDFPSFVARFESTQTVPYLADVARLEVAWSEAYHALDAASLGADALISSSAEDLVQARIGLQPSLRLLRSIYPVATIWSAHQGAGTVKAPDAWEPEDVVVVRPDTEVLVHRLPPGAYAFISALALGTSIGQSASAALAESEEFDLGKNLVNLFAIGAVVALHTFPPREVIS